LSIPRGALVLSPEDGPSLIKPRERALVLSPEDGPSLFKPRGRALVLSPEERSSFNHHHQAAWAFKQATLCVTMLC